MSLLGATILTAIATLQERLFELGRVLADAGPVELAV
jgi:hypothetical protein